MIPTNVFAAQQETNPKRIVFFTSPNGSRILDGWRPKFGPGAIQPKKLNPILAPLADLHKEMLMVEGLDMSTLFQDEQNKQSKGHYCRATLWTGQVNNAVVTCGNHRGWPKGPSIDRLIWQKLGGPEPSYISIGTNGCARAHSYAHYEGEGQPIPGVSSPEQYWLEQFSEVQLSNDVAARRKAAKAAIYSATHGELKRLKTVIPSADHDRFDGHIKAMANLKALLTTNTNATACDVLVENPALGQLKTTNSKWDRVKATQTWFELIAASMRCDKSRIFGVQWGVEGHTGNANFLNASGNIHILSHDAKSNPKAHAVMVEFNAFFAQQLATFCKGLQSTPEGNGTMLDNTIVVWGTAMSEGSNHSNRNLPFVVLGGRNMGLNLGQ
jgi:hypothetical protein